MLRPQIITGKNNLPVPTPLTVITPVLVGRGKMKIGYITHLSHAGGDFHNAADDGFYIDPSKMALLIFPSSFFTRLNNLRYGNRFDTLEAAMTAFKTSFRKFLLHQL